LYLVQWNRQLRSHKKTERSNAEIAPSRQLEEDRVLSGVAAEDFMTWRSFGIHDYYGLLGGISEFCSIFRYDGRIGVEPTRFKDLDRLHCDHAATSWESYQSGEGAGTTLSMVS